MSCLFAKFRASILLAAICLVTSTIAQTVAFPPGTIKATYKIYKAGIWIGTINEQFTRDNNHYRIVSDTVTAGPLRLLLRDQLTVTSDGAVDANGLKPENYRFMRRNDQNKNVVATFAWNIHQIKSQHADKQEIFDLPEGTQDRVSAMYQFMFSVPTAAAVSMWMSQGKKAEQYHYRKQGEPVLVINQESIPTIYYAREARADESKVHLWLAKAKYFLPVKIVFEDAKGGSLEQILVTLQAE